MCSSYEYDDHFSTHGCRVMTEGFFLKNAIFCCFLIVNHQRCSLLLIDSFQINGKVFFFEMVEVHFLLEKCVEVAIFQKILEEIQESSKSTFISFHKRFSISFWGKSNPIRVFFQVNRYNSFFVNNKQVLLRSVRNLGK